jgi:SAM-dependent methyltransferase
MPEFAPHSSQRPPLNVLARLTLVVRNRSRLLVRRGRSVIHRGIDSQQASTRRVLKTVERALSRTGRRIGKQRDRWVPALQLGSDRVVNWLGYLNPSFAVPGERVACPACASRSLTQLDILWQLRRHAGRFVGFMTGCRTCGLVFANPLPTAEELAAYYAPDSDYVDRRWKRAAPPAESRESPSMTPLAETGAAAVPGNVAAASTIETPREPAHRLDQHDKLSLLFSSVAEYLDVFHPPAGAKVLDYGCGPGRVLDRLKPAGWSTFGIEPALKSAFTRHTELVDPPAQPTFHLVIVHHVLEHLLNPLDVLKQIASSMVDGGIIYISVPRLDAIDRHGDLRYCINSHGHVMSYTRECMTALLAMAGLTAIDVKNDADLDRLLTGGDPRRLRVFARKAGAATVPASPLAAAERALQGYRARFEPTSSRALSAVPVRLRASWLHRARTATVLAHRSQKLSAVRAGGSGSGR